MVITVRYVNSDIFRERLGARIYERVPDNTGINKPSLVKESPNYALTKQMILIFIIISQFQYKRHHDAHLTYDVNGFYFNLAAPITLLIFQCFNSMVSIPSIWN
ncbi:hypothetical protein D0T88_26155 (plasmid) [Escherichia coli]|nr:hypothetical protein [Escherichia coli]EFO1241813.1 hypothetical protein [Escherichia coli]MHT49962.1 hypothetical protein [Escherichia coli]QPA07837.1 hypothetical protein D0T88_26155 [Escherichia coli]